MGVRAAATQPIPEAIGAGLAQVQVGLVKLVGELAGLDLKNRVTTQDGRSASVAMNLPGSHGQRDSRSAAICLYFARCRRRSSCDSRKFSIFFFSKIAQSSRMSAIRSSISASNSLPLLPLAQGRQFSLDQAQHFPFRSLGIECIVALHPSDESPVESERVD